MRACLALALALSLARCDPIRPQVEPLSPRAAPAAAAGRPLAPVERADAAVAPRPEPSDPDASTTPIATATATALGDAAPADEATASNSSSPAELATVSVELEPVVRLGASVRPAGSVAASVHDEELARWNTGGGSDPQLASNRAGFHPAVRIVIDTTITYGRTPAGDRRRGRFSRASLQAESRSSGYWPARLCYEAALRRTSGLSGKMRVRATLTRHGSISAARYVGGDLRDRELAACLTSAVRGLRYRVAPSGRIDFDLLFSLWPGDVAVSKAPEKTLDQSAAPIADNVARALAATRAQLQACYLAALRRDPKLWGRLALRIDIASSGRVVSSTEYESQFPDRELVACVERRIAEIAFPEHGDSLMSLIFAARFGALPAPAQPSTISSDVVP